ncbi:uncharacterized protein LOC144122116 isoform X2 [Amblyomma americanum]
MRTKTWTLETWDAPSKTKTEKSSEEPAHLAEQQAGGPDGRLSWFIAALCFLVNLLFSSFFRCGGLFFTSIMSTYDASRGYASLPLSMYSGFVHVSGLIAGPLIHWFDVRCVAVLGGLMMAVGCMSSYFANGIPFLVGSLGVVTGIGHGLLFSCVIIAINEYFDKRRGVALGINMTGATAASFIFPKIFDVLIDEYGLHGTLALTGALLLNIAAVSILFRKPPWEVVARKEHAKKESAEKHKQDALTSNSKDCNLAHGPRPSITVTAPGTPMGRRGTQMCVSDKDLLHHKRITLLTQPDNSPFRSTTFDICHGDNLTAEEEINEARSRRGTLLSVASSLIEEERVMVGSRRATVINLTKKGSVVGELDLRKIALLQEAVDQLSNGNSALSSTEEKAAFLDSGHDVKMESHPSMLRRPSSWSQVAVSRRGTFACIEPRCQIEFPSKPDEPIRVIIPPLEKKSDSALDSAKVVLALPRFYCHMISYLSFCFFLDTFLAVAIDYAVDVGIESGSAVFVLTFFSVTDTVGRLFVPLLTDYKIVSPYSLMSLSYLAMAVIAQSMPYAQDLVPFWTSMIALGLPVGYIMVAISEGVTNEVGVRNLPMAYGFMAGLTAVGAFMRPVVVGVIRGSGFQGNGRLLARTLHPSAPPTTVACCWCQRGRPLRS